MTHPCNFDDTFVNVAAYLPMRAKSMPTKIAIAFPEGRDRLNRCSWTMLTYLELEKLSSQYAEGLENAGVTQGARTVLMVRPSLDFIALAFALFKIGAVPVLIDPGMGIRSLLNCIKGVEPDAFVAIPEAMTASKILRSSFKTIKCAVTVGTSSLLTPHCTDDFIKQYKGNYPVRQTNPEDTAAILFTTGSTGPAKGVVYRHRMFEAQVQQLMQYYGIEENEVELPAFPLFALFSPALGVTCVIPDMDPTRPAQVNPANIVEAVNTWQVTNTFGSPSIWRKVTEYCVREGIKLPSLRRVLMAGAPVPLEVLGRFTQILGPAGETHTPYGATETLPTTNACGSDILKPENVKKNREGRGTFVGQPLPGMQVKIIKIVDDVITNFDEKLLLPQGQIGEIIATGPVTTYNYFSLEKATKKAKIAEGETIWHRMGDTGYFDEDNNLWFCGRMAHRVITGEETLFTIPCETIFNNHSAIFRSALVGIGKKGQQEPVIIVEPHGKFWPETDKHKKELVAELLDLGQEKAHTKNIKKVLFCRELPTDIRHNAKIFREKLAKWAAEQGWKTTPGLRKYFFDF